MSAQQTTTGRRITLRGELALTVAVIINSFAVAMTVYAGLGISPVSSFPYAISLVFPFLTLGTWTYLFQGLLVISLMVLRRKFVPSYLFSFVVGFFFGTLLDVFGAWLPCLPFTLGWRIFYFVLSCPIVGFGIALSNRCKLPIIPTDLFPREVSAVTGLPYQRVKTVFDLSCLAVTLTLLLAAVHRVSGIGVGTVFCALVMGKVIARAGAALERRFCFVSFLEPEEN